jgi:hypothetical protein
LPRNVSDLKADWALRLCLQDYGAPDDLIATHHIAHAQGSEIARPQFAVDGQIEHGELSHVVFVL